MRAWLRRAAILCAMLTAVVLWGFFGSKYALEVSSYAITSPKISEPIRIVQLTDLHNRSFGQDNARLVRFVRGQCPDLIVLTGDMLNGDQADTAIAAALIEQLSRIAPVYASRGNHEKAHGVIFGTDVAALYARAGAQLLERTFTDVQVNGQTIRLGGVFGYCLSEKYLRSGEAKWGEVQFLRRMEDTDHLTVLLCHMPLCFIVNDNLEAWDIDCVFSGHVHGGQVRLPLLGGLYAPDQGYFPGQECGLYYSEDRRRVLILSRGLGSSGRVPRFNNVPEVVVVDILPEKDEG